jgi:hypothetical protein
MLLSIGSILSLKIATTFLRSGKKLLRKPVFLSTIPSGTKENVERVQREE